MVHVSQLDTEPVKNPRDLFKLGDELMVMVTGIDEAGKIRLSRQAVLEGWTPEQAAARDRGPRTGGERGGERGARPRASQRGGERTSRGREGERGRSGYRPRR
jgi:polyribonucleotide nucleotidyltransferase